MYALELSACAHVESPKETTNTGATSTWTKNESMGPNGMPYNSAAPSSGTPTTLPNEPSTVVFPRPAIQPTVGPSGSAHDPNTAANERDRRDTATQFKWGNTKPELDITASIRRAVVASKALGFTAKYVKIITVGTKVTLRGPVNTAQERDIIETHAKQAPGVSEVDNQLGVKSK